MRAVEGAGPYAANGLASPERGGVAGVSRPPLTEGMPPLQGEVSPAQAPVTEGFCAAPVSLRASDRVTGVAIRIPVGAAISRPQT